MALGWPVGEVLGSEADLLERYQVSRAVFREAVRLLEHQQVARTRRGPGGGLVITEPTIGAVIDAVVLYLHRVDARLDEIFEARIVLEELAAQLASERTDELELNELRRFAHSDPVEPERDPRELHALVAASQPQRRSRTVRRRAQPGGPALLARLASPRSSVEQEAVHAHAMIAEAVMAGDGGLARNRMRKHLAGRGRVLPPPPLDPATAARLGGARRVGPRQGRREPSPATSPRRSWPRTCSRGTSWAPSRSSLRAKA